MSPVRLITLIATMAIVLTLQAGCGSGADVEKRSGVTVHRGETTLPPGPPATAEDEAQEEAPDGWNLQGPDGERRRAALLGLAQEYREKIRAVLERYRGVRSPEKRQALADLRRWYRERLRAIVTDPGGGPAGAPPPPP